MMSGKGHKIKRICIITAGYPTNERAVNTFVDQLVCEFADAGIDCTVISPHSVTSALIHKAGKAPLYRERATLAGNIIKVYAPRFVSASNYKKGILNTAVLTLNSFMFSATRVFNRLNKVKPFDAVYGHFISPSGITANHISEMYGTPAFLAYGENTNYTIDWFGAEKTREKLAALRGVISVSTANADNLIRQGIVSEEIIGIFPNSVNKKVFYPRNKSEMRAKYGLPQDAFIAAFVGRFVEIKGANRLSEAIEKVGSDRVKSIFIGSGDVGPKCGGILIIGPQPHSNIPELLSSADIFVLPTLAEGCSNAIIEAMACGLPIVSSNRTFNDDIIDDTCSIRIDPNDVDEIADAIELLLNDENIRRNISEGALRRAKQLDIETRARNIIEFMESKI
jgi:teichuronic acid biosynthesis glycosyltransferase TuaC